MAFTQSETQYMEDNRSIFDSRDLGKILNSLDRSISEGELTRREASKIAFFTALVINPDSICLIIENRGKSRSRYRAEAGQKILRIYYGITDKSLITGDSNTVVKWLPGPTRMFEFTYFRGTLTPERLERLMLKPLMEYNTRVFGKSYESLAMKIMSKVDWRNI